MDRRAFLGILAGGLLATPLAVWAQRVQGHSLGPIEGNRTRSYREMFR
jgi:hypothetical protein